jgi:DNA segregation ATPase FtsK/SpoIIIE-like protein
VLYSLMLHNSPTALQITVVDPKNSSDIKLLCGLPHVRLVDSELAESVKTLENFHGEMVRRERGLADKDVRHVLVIEECASLTEHPDKQLRGRVIYWLSDIARRCREANMNLIVATQKPTADVLGDQLKSNLLMRLVGSVTSKDDANTAVQVKASGAEALPGYGSFIYRLNRTMVRYQVPLIDTPAGLCRDICRKADVPWVVQSGANAPVRTGAGGANEDRTRVERRDPVAPVQVVQPFPLADKRPLSTDEAAEVRKLAATMSKNLLCVHVYGAKSSRYMEWINTALADSPPPAVKKAPAFGRILASLVREVKPL